MNTAQFLARVRQAVQLADTTEDWSDTEILTEGTNALYERFAQPISALRHGYWLHRTAMNMVAGQQLYRIPHRALVQGLEKVEISDDGGTRWWQLSILTDGEATDYQNGNSRGTPNFFSYQGDCLALYPIPSSSSLKIRFSYYLRPSTLIAQPTGGVVSQVLHGGGVYTVYLTTDTLPSGLDATLGGSGTIDFVHTTGCNEVAMQDVPYTDFNTIDKFFLVADTYDLSNVIAGDVVRVPDTTDYVPLPIELHSAFVAWTAAVILANKGDFEKAGVMSAKAEKAIQRVVDMAVPRTKTRPYEFRTRNTFLRRRTGFWGTGWRGN